MKGWLDPLGEGLVSITRPQGPIDPRFLGTDAQFLRNPGGILIPEDSQGGFLTLSCSTSTSGRADGMAPSVVRTPGQTARYNSILCRSDEWKCWGRIWE